MDIGISFKNLREGKGKSVYALSKETGVSENHIHSIEKGSTQPSVAILERLLNALGVTLPEFFNEDREVLYPSAYERELIASVRKLDGEQAHTGVIAQPACAVYIKFAVRPRNKPQVAERGVRLVGRAV